MRETTGEKRSGSRTIKIEMTDEEVIAIIKARRREARRRKRQKKIRRIAIMLIGVIALSVMFRVTYVNHILGPEKAGTEYTDSDAEIVSVAREQLGNYGGEEFWRWFGFDYQVDWCAIFVSWCANECGYIDDGMINKFAMVDDGVNYFMLEGRWKDPDEYKPKGGEVIFFDGDKDGYVDHVGLVSGTWKDRVFTIEGNVGYTQHSTNPNDPDAGSVDDEGNDWIGECARRGYLYKDKRIYGYGLLKEE